MPRDIFLSFSTCYCIVESGDALVYVRKECPFSPFSDNKEAISQTMLYQASSHIISLVSEKSQNDKNK